ncbi:uncharacterized protein LOC130445144 [Diorhabda sublineata]|uniref:uncharacterized protein LOC130445144 n=1 Tax=Diorhabda sublineata TaxID=1163346 RepID=UPI0024E136FB|nr:uncharacterized protein LOC130445144 [Diorhabda sublineata]
MKVTVFSSVLLCCLLGCDTLIVPDEIPSLLSVVYSNIPTVKKGTDSRIGWGFKLGNRADFQVLVELGPQTYTQPIQNQNPKENTNKRNTLETLADTLYAQNNELKRLKAQIQNEEASIPVKNEENKSIDNITGSEAADWLKRWSASAEKTSDYVSVGVKPGLGIGEIDAKSVIPEDEDDKLRNNATEMQNKHSTQK